MFWELFYFFLGMAYFFNGIFALIIIFNGKNNPAITWAWLLVVVSLPYIGFILYLIFGFDNKRHSDFHKKQIDDLKIIESFFSLPYESISFLKQQDIIVNDINYLELKNGKRLHHILRLNHLIDRSFMSKNNEVETFFNGNKKFESLFDDISQAKKYIHLQYYILRNDTLGKKLLELLEKKVMEGLEVKLMIDGMGNLFTQKKLFRKFTHSGGKLVIFMPFHFFRINSRNHRKIAVIDGKIGYIGGFNVGDEYLGKVKRYGHWRDAHIKIMGDAVKALQLRFILDWNFCSEDKIELSESYFPPIEQVKYPTNIQIVSSGPDTKWQNILYSYNKMISEAESTVFIVTPYFVPDESLLQSMRIAVLSGVSISIMIPAHPDHHFVYDASISYLRELCDIGVKCYQYERGFIHSKILIVDGQIISVGTANLDIRSFKLNFEVNAFIYNSYISKFFEERFEKDLEDSTELTPEWFQSRSFFHIFKESFARLISPLL